MPKTVVPTREAVIAISRFRRAENDQAAGQDVATGERSRSKTSSHGHTHVRTFASNGQRGVEGEKIARCSPRKPVIG